VTRVLHLRNSDRFGGPERLLLDQVRLASAGMEHVLASFGAADAPHPFLDRAREEGAVTCVVPQSSSYDPRAATRTRALIREMGPDVVVGHDYKANIVLALASGTRPRVAVVHGYTGEDSKVRFFEAIDRQVVRTADAVVCVADALRTRLVDAGVAPERVHLVPNGVNAERVQAAARAGREDRRRAWAVSMEEILVLVLGRLSPEKGQDVALEAFAALRREGVRLVLAGDGAARPVLEDRARRLGLEVDFAGWVSDPWACLGAADVFLLPSRTEGLPLALLEAMAAARPVVATGVGAVPEVLEDGACGLLVPPGDASALAAALVEVLDRPAEARARAARASQRVRAVYSSAAQARRLEEIYVSLVRCQAPRKGQGETPVP